MNDSRYLAIHATLSRLETPQIVRILSTPQGEMVCDQYAYDAATGHY